MARSMGGAVSLSVLWESPLDFMDLHTTKLWRARGAARRSVSRKQACVPVNLQTDVDGICRTPME